MVFGIIIHSFLPNPQLLNIQTLIQTNQGPIKENRTSSSTSSTYSSHIDLSSKPVYSSQLSKTPTKTPISFHDAFSTSTRSTGTNSNVPIIFNGSPVTLETAGLAGNAPTSVTVYFSDFYYNFGEFKSEIENFAQEVSVCSTKAFYEQQQFSLGMTNNEIQFDLQQRRENTPGSFSTNVTDSVWASPAFNHSGENLAVQDGVYSLPSNDIVKQPLTVYWRRQQGLIFTLLCYEDENKSAILDFLQNIPKLLSLQLKNPQLCSNPRDIMAKPEEVLVLLHSLIPMGLLPIYPSSIFKQLKRELDT